MAKRNTYYFSHDCNARDDAKLVALRMKLGAEGYGVYWLIVEYLSTQPDCMGTTDYNVIAFSLHVGSDIIKKVINDFGLFHLSDDGTMFYSESLCRRMSAVSDKSSSKRESVKAKWGFGSADQVVPGSASLPSEHKPTNSELRAQRMSEARKKGTHTQEEWVEMLQFFGKECVVCGSKANIVQDHIVPIYQGGSDSIRNLEPLCRTCNSSKGPDNVDHRVEWCERHGVEMPEKWLQDRSDVYEMSTKCLRDRIEMSTNKGKEIKGKKESEREIPPPPPDEPQTPIQPTPTQTPASVVGCYMTLPNLLAEVMSDIDGSKGGTKFCENCCMDLKVTPPQLVGLLKEFHRGLEIEDENQTKTLRDYRSHFSNWARIQVRKNNEQRSKSQQLGGQVCSDAGKFLGGLS